MNTAVQTHKELALPPDFTDADLAMLPEVEVDFLRKQGILEPIETLLKEPGAPEAPAQVAQPAEDEAANAAMEAAKAADDEAKAKGAADDLAALPTVKMADVPDTAAAEKAVADARAERKDLTQKFNDGELSEDDYNTGIDAILTREAEAKAEIVNAQRISEQNKQAFLNDWYARTDRYMSANEDFKDPAVVDAFDTALKTVNGAQSYRNLSADARITLAHRMVVAEAEARGITLKGPAAKEAPKAAAEPKTTKAEDGPRSDPRPDPVQTLSGVPNSAQNDPSNGRFAALDRDAVTDPYRAEQAYKRMTPDEQAAWLRGA